MPVTSQHQDGVAILTIDRPERRNALDLEAWHGLRDQARAIPAGTRAIIVTGAGGHFCAGMDLSPANPLIPRIGPAIVGGDEEAARAVIEELKDCVAALAESGVPTFAAIEGACIGGGLEVALGCDVRICATDAVIGLTEVRIGMIPDLGGCARLTRLVGPGRAADLVTTARKIDGEEAFRLGIVERTCAPGTALEVALAAARQVVENAPSAVRLALNVVRVSPDLGLAEALSVETRGGVLALTSGEPQEGVTAFFERRPPRWE